MFLRSSFWSLIFVFLCGSVVLAQVVPTISKIDTTGFPTVRLHVTTTINSEVDPNLTKANFTVFEDSVEQTVTSVSCPTQTNAFSLVIVIGRGSKMGAAGVTIAKSAAKNVIDQFDGVMDEGELIVYSSSHSVMVLMTTDKTFLTQGVDGVTATNDANHLWDAVAAAINEVVGNAGNTVQAVLVLSEGTDDGSNASLSDVILLANASKIPVYCVSVTGGGSSQNLKSLSDNTGGKYWGNAGSGFETELISILRGRNKPCIVTYTSDNLCRDGFERLVQVVVKKDNESGTGEERYTVAAAGSPDERVTVDFAAPEFESGREANVTLHIQPASFPGRIYSGVLTLQFDTSKLHPRSVSVDGAFPALSAFMTPTQTGAEIALSGHAVITSAGAFLTLRFEGGMTQQAVDVPLTLSSFTQDRGCTVANSPTINVRLIPPQPRAELSASGPLQLTWSSALGSYEPAPAVIIAELRNTGLVRLTGVTGSISLPGGATLDASTPAQQTADPPDIDPGQSATVSWKTYFAPQTSNKQVRLTVSMRSNELSSVARDLAINIPVAGPLMRATCSYEPVIRSGDAYSPNPFAFLVIVKNAGGTRATAKVKVNLPSILTAHNGVTEHTLSSVVPGGADSATFLLRIDTTHVILRDTTVFVTTVVTGSGFPDDTCQTAVRIPGQAFAVACDIITNDSVRVISGNYVPDPLPVAVQVENQGSAALVGGEIGLFFDTTVFRLADGETASRSIPSLSPGGKYTEQWHLLVQRPLCKDATSKLTTITRFGTDTLPCMKQIWVEQSENQAPVIIARAPGKLDTLAPGSRQVFSVETRDTDGDSMTYRWLVDGSEQGSDSTTFAMAFDSAGTYTVSCIVGDGCLSDTTSWVVIVSNTTGIAGSGAIRGFELHPVFPNPFNPSATVRFTLPAGRHRVKIRVLDMFGREVLQLVNREYPPGTHQVTILGGRLPAGMYLVEMTAGAVRLTGHILRIR
ncbi:MAG: VWA domain-containing protein [Chlorobi bacterium]|nr:VWA domain-containing protein [Chlorobiota bacterium]